MKKLVIILLLAITNCATAQTIEIVSAVNFKPAEESKDFTFVEPAADTSLLQRIATLKAISENKKATVSELFFKLKKQAQALGANCFRLNTFSRDSLNRPVITLDVYYADDVFLTTNFDNHEKNVVFIFCDDRVGDEKYSLKVNDEKKEFRSGTFLHYELKYGQELKVSKGGFTGATMWINYKENRQAVFLTITGFGLGGGPVPQGTIGMSFNTGRINYVEANLGHLLTQLLKLAQ